MCVQIFTKNILFVYFVYIENIVVKGKGIDGVWFYAYVSCYVSLTMIFFSPQWEEGRTFRIDVSYCNNYYENTYFIIFLMILIIIQ